MSMPTGLELATGIPLDLMTATKKPPKENYIAKLATILMPAQASTPVYTKTKTFKGKSTIFFKANDYYGVMKDKCRLTLVGKFFARRPKLEILGILDEEENPVGGYEQSIEYEGTPDYCLQCKHQ
ncbi:hypothetical protein HAX54_019152, partial [Datura stramonium]|nr:hypothetical protein [Datura stramonium]